MERCFRDQELKLLAEPGATAGSPAEACMPYIVENLTIRARVLTKSTFCHQVGTLRGQSTGAPRCYLPPCSVRTHCVGYFLPAAFTRESHRSTLDFIVHNRMSCGGETGRYMGMSYRVHQSAIDGCTVPLQLFMLALTLPVASVGFPPMDFLEFCFSVFTGIPHAFARKGE